VCNLIVIPLVIIVLRLKHFAEFMNVFVLMHSCVYHALSFILIYKSYAVNNKLCVLTLFVVKLTN